MRTSIRFPSSRDLPQDSKGRPSGSWTWGDSIPATARDTTARERGASYGAGYNADRVYEILKDSYSDDMYLQDDSDGRTYKIERAGLSTDGRWVTLEVSRVDAFTYPIAGEV